MFVTNLLSIRVFVIIYRCFIRKYVTIFQNVVLNVFGVLVDGCWVFNVRCWVFNVRC